MEEESNDSSSTSASSNTASSRFLASSEIKQDDDDDRTLQHQRNLNNILDRYTERYEELPKGRQKLVDKIFHEKFQDLVRFHREHGHWKVPSIERRLYVFLTTLHRIYRCAYYNGECCDTNIFPRHRYEKMVAIGYPFEDITIQETTLEEDDDISITSTIDSRASTSSIGKVKQDEEEDRTLDYQSNLEKVLDKYTERYEAQPAKCQRRYDDIFDGHVQALVDFHRNFEHWRVPSSLTGLYGWTVQINCMYRYAYFEGECYNSYILPRHRYQKLLAIGYPFNEEIGDVTISLCSGRSTSDDDEELMEYQKNLNTVLSTYTKRYEKIPKKSQKLYDKNFDAHIKTLVDFHKKYGHWKVPCTKEYSSLYYWVEKIYRIFRCAYYDGKCSDCGILTKHRYGKLAVIGFPFELEETENKEEEEEVGVEALEGCKKKLNKVIDQYTARYKKLSEKQKSRYDGQFDMKLKHLVEFHRKYGHWKVSRDESIYNWLQCLHKTFKKAYFKGQRSGTSVLPRHRYEKLVAIGYPFIEIIQDSTPKDDGDSLSSDVLSADDDDSLSANVLPPLLFPSTSVYSTTTPSIDSNEERPKRNEDNMHTRRIKARKTKAMNLIRSTREATTTTNTSRENKIQLLKATISQLEKENESHYDTIYRLKDEKESLLEKLEDRNKQLDGYKKREHSSEEDNMKSTSSSSKRQRTSSQPRDAEIERLQQERQLLIEQLTASTENYRKLLDLIPRSQTK